MDSERIKIIDRKIKKTSGKILNIGTTGSIMHSVLLKQNPAKKITGLDIVAANQKENTVKGDITKAPFPDSEFELIIAGEIIEHLKFPNKTEKMLKECLRILKKRGSLIITTPNKKAWSNILFHKFDHANPEYGGHEKIFLPRELEEFVRKNGFGEIQKKTTYYTEESSPGQRKAVYFVRKLADKIMPGALKEQIILLAKKV
jgi:ubiquinone/menaquinone biosynthesis C-methylase UbiE